MKKSTIYSSKPYTVAPLYGLIAGWLIDRYSPRKMMLASSLMAGDLFGVKTLGRVMGIILVTNGRAESLSPMMVCTLDNDALKSYSPGFIVLICLAMSGALIRLCVKLQRTRRLGLIPRCLHRVLSPELTLGFIPFD